jgi:hypothetical protein
MPTRTQRVFIEELNLETDMRFVGDDVSVTDAISGATTASNFDVINEVTPNAGVTVDGVKCKDGSVEMIGGPVQYPRGTASTSIVQGFGKTSGEGMQVAIIEETISFVANAALYKELTYSLPANAVILSAQMNIESALTGGSTTVKVGLGSSADPDLWGKTSVLTKNAKSTLTPAWAVIASTTPIRVSSCATAGGAGDTALTVGSVRVRIVFLAPVDLVDAA